MVTPENSITIKHFLVDYDGLLLDTEKLYFQTWASLLNDEGTEICKKNHEGLHEEQVYDLVKNYLKTQLPLAEISKNRQEKFDEMVRQGNLSLLPGVQLMLSKLEARAPLSIVSNSTLDIVEHGLEATGINKYFFNKYCMCEGKKRKPAPDIYLEALHDLTLNKKDVLAIEDSKSGITAAREAGIRVICINQNLAMENFCLDLNIAYYPSADIFIHEFEFK